MEEKTREGLLIENEELRARLFEAEDVLRAIREGKVDALAISTPRGEKVFTLEGADRFYRTLIETMNEGALMLSLDGSILYGNSRIEEMLAIPMERMVGTSLGDRVPEEEREAFHALMALGRVESAKGEVHFKGRDGTLIPVKLSMRRMPFGEIDAVCAIVTDLSEQKETRGELNSYAAMLDQSNEKLREFVFVASHDLQEPLRKIQVFCSKIQARFYDPLDEELKLDLTRLQTAAERMRALLHAMLNYSRLMSLPEPFSQVDLNDLLEKILADFQDSISETGGRVEVSELPHIDADPGQMRELFVHLISNALKFRRDEPPLVRIHADMEEGVCRILVEDNGIGFSESSAAHIFKPFQRLHGMSAGYEGTGMGLALCRKIVERHGGSILAKSFPGKGSTFIVTLPCKQPGGKSRLFTSVKGKTKEELFQEVESLQERLLESESLLRAIREAKVDGFVLYEPEGAKIYTLKSADRSYRMLIEAISEGALTVRRDGMIFYCNRRLEEMLKTPQQQLLGSSLFDYVIARDRPILEDFLSRLDREGKFKSEMLLQAGDGTTVPVLLSLSPIEMDGFSGGCIVATDLTEQKKRAAELAGFNHKLRAELGERKRVEAKLQESNQALDEFASIAAHDLREPLRKVLSFGSKLEKNYRSALGEEGKDYLYRMLQATGRMQTLLTSLLEYSRLSTRANDFMKVRLGDLIRGVLSDLEVRIEQTGGRVEVGELSLIEADPTQMRQLFQNLIGNALKFHKPDENPCIRIYGRRKAEGPFYEITVEDNGIGFDEKYLDLIFAPFQRLHGRDSRYEGTGMGLTICKRIVERHGGTITARSAPGEGATFIIALPISSSPDVSQRS